MTFDLFVDWIFVCPKKRDLESLWNEYLLIPTLWFTRTQAMQAFLFLPLMVIQEHNYFNRFHMTYNCKKITLQSPKKSLNLYINISLLYSCIVCWNGSGPWWFLVAQVQAIRLERSLTEELGIETSLPCFLSNSGFAWCLGFLCSYPSPKRKGSPLVLIPFTLGK